MSEIKFVIDGGATTLKNKKVEYSLNYFLRKHCSLVIKNKKQADLAQLVFIGIVFLYLVLFFIKNNTAIQIQTPPSLINAIQPEGPLP